MPENNDLGYRTAEASEEGVLLEQAKRAEAAHIASERSSVTASGGVFTLHLSNPEGSGVDANVQRIKITSQFEGVIDVWDTFTSAPSGGTAATIDNLLLDSNQDNGMGQIDVLTGVSFTGENPHYQSVLPSGGPGGSFGGQLEEGAPLIEPGREIVVEVTNQSGSDDDAAITVVYVEEERE